MYWDAPEGQATASFIFLHDIRSSGDRLHYEIENAISPHPLQFVLPGARIMMPDGPYADFRLNTAGIIQGAVNEPANEWFWFGTDDSIGADETATAVQWRQFGKSLGCLERLVHREAGEVGRENVFIVGFGMGFATAAAFLLQMEEPIGGLFGVNPLMPFHVDLKYIALDGQTKAVVEHNLEMEREKKEEEQRRKEYEREEESSFDDSDDDDWFDSDDEFDSDTSTGTLCADGKNAQTHKARRERAMGFFQYLAYQEEAPISKRVCSRSDASTPIILLHGRNNWKIPFEYGKKALQTFQNLGYQVELDILEEEYHLLSRNMLGELFNKFMLQGLGNERTRESIGDCLMRGLFEDKKEKIWRRY
ncbi:Alpha/Beta hydrolase protein [Trichoderma barbatum]